MASMAKAEIHDTSALDTESKKSPEKAPSLTKETVSAQRVEDAADKLTRLMAESVSGTKRRFTEKAPTLGQKAEALFGKMMEKVQDVKNRMNVLSEIVKGRSQKGTETGTQTEKSLTELQKNFEAKSPAEQKDALLKGVELISTLQAVQKNKETPQKVEGGRGESERILLEEKIPTSMRIPIDGVMTFREEGHFDNTQREFYTDKDLIEQRGKMNAMGGVIGFIDKSGKAWATGDTPQSRKDLADAGYDMDNSVKVPFANGEELSSSDLDPSLENYQAKWKRIQGIARARREEASIAQRQVQEKKAA